MQEKPKAVMHWSGGKDAALALYKVLQEDKIEVLALLSTFSQESGHSSAHEIPLTIIEAQAKSIGIPLYTLSIQAEMQNYMLEMQKAVTHFKALGVTQFIYGDIDLQDIKSFRAAQLKPFGIEVIEPLWGMSTQEVMQAFFKSGLQACIVTADADKLGQDIIGKNLQASLLADFPAAVDICGEDGSYHSLVYAGPLFKKPIAYTIQEVELKSYNVKHSDGHIHELRYWHARFKNWDAL